MAKAISGFEKTDEWIGIYNNAIKSAKKKVGEALNYSDSYFTPEKVYEALPINWKNYKTAYEPSMGDGRLFLFLEEQGLQVDGGDVIYGEDESFFEWDGYVDLIITNPPFSMGEEFIQYARSRADTVIMLHQQSFMATKRRFNFWKENVPDATFLYNTQIDFTGLGRGRAAQYCQWYVWQQKEKHIKPGMWVYQDDGQTNYPC